MAPNFKPRNDLPEPLVVERLTKRYGQDKPVLENLNRTFQPGIATALVGPNGSGKTTLLRLLTARAFPTEGRVRYGELNIHQNPYEYLKHVGIVYADAHLPEHLTATELLEWILRERGLWDDDGAERVAAVLDAVLLDERRENLIGTYSSGMLQKTQVASALVAQPPVLLMDEPFRGLDAESTVAVEELLNEFKQAGGLLILSSHDQSLIDALSDEVMRMGAEPAPMEQRS